MTVMNPQAKNRLASSLSAAACVFACPPAAASSEMAGNDPPFQGMQTALRNLSDYILSRVEVNREGAMEVSCKNAAGAALIAGCSLLALANGAAAVTARRV